MCRREENELRLKASGPRPLWFLSCEPRWILMHAHEWKEGLWGKFPEGLCSSISCRWPILAPSKVERSVDRIDVLCRLGDNLATWHQGDGLVKVNKWFEEGSWNCQNWQQYVRVLMCYHLGILLQNFTNGWTPYKARDGRYLNSHLQPSYGFKKIPSYFYLVLMIHSKSSCNVTHGPTKSSCNVTHGCYEIIM
jgi:hypothetical protein